MKIIVIVWPLLLAVLFSTVHSQSIEPLTFSVSPGQVTEASVILTADTTHLKMNLTPEKRIELADFTQQNLEKQVKIVVVGKLVEEPIIKVHMIGGSMDVIVASPEEGLAIAKALMAK